MSKSTHQMAVKAVDQTAGGFASIQARAAAASAKLRSMLGGAMAAAGAYFGFRSIAGAINELGTLSDIAQKSSVSVDDLTKSATALNVLGVQNMGVEQMAKAFQLMEKNTGRTGMEGFYQTIQEIGKIPDLSERAQAAMAVFGRSGMEFMPLINAADTSTNALKDVIDVMPGIPQSAADAGDDAADAMNIMAGNVKKIWMQSIATIVGWFGKNYEGGIRTAALHAGNYLEYFTKTAVLNSVEWLDKLGQKLTLVFGFYKTFIKQAAQNIYKGLGDAVGDGRNQNFAVDASVNAVRGIKAAWRAASHEMNGVKKELDVINRRQYDERYERWAMDFADREVKIQKFAKGYQKAVRTSKDRTLLDGAAGDLLGGKARQKITNELILGGSAKSLNLAMMGPQMNNELKKQTNILERIRVNTQKTEENTRDVAEGENYEVIA